MQVAIAFGRTGPHAGDEHIAPVGLDRRHEIVVFTRGAGTVAYFEDHTGSLILEFAFERVIRRRRLDIVLFEINELQGQVAIPGGQDLFTAHHAFNVDAAHLIIVEGPDFDFQMRTTVTKRGLVDGIAAIAQRMVNRDGGLKLFIFFLIMNHQITFKGFGLAGVIMLDTKILELDGEGQILHHGAITNI